MIKLPSIITLCSVALLLSSCAGYTLGGKKPTHLAGVTKLAVPTFENQTLEPRIASTVTNALIKQIQMDGSYQIVPEDEADAVLKGSVTRVGRTQFRSNRLNVLSTSQLQLTLSTQFTITDTTSGRPIHKGNSSASSYVILDTNVQNSEAQALEDAAQRLSGFIANEISEGW
ncbi:MAG: LptE family protein [Verrucomicrobia bacterium]|nr:LptE family protein [Verrucomicrobiota bacterium]